MDFDLTTIKTGIKILEDDEIPLALLISARDAAFKVLCEDNRMGCDLSNYEILNIDFSKINDNDYKKNFLLELSKFLQDFINPGIPRRIYNMLNNYINENRTLLGAIFVLIEIGMFYKYSADAKVKESESKVKELEEKTRNLFNFVDMFLNNRLLDESKVHYN